MIASAFDGVATARCKDVADGTRASKNRRAPSKGWVPLRRIPRPKVVHVLSAHCAFRG